MTIGIVVHYGFNEPKALLGSLIMVVLFGGYYFYFRKNEMKEDSNQKSPDDKNDQNPTGQP